MVPGIEYVIGGVSSSLYEGSVDAGLDNGLLVRDKTGDCPMGWQIPGTSRGSQRPQEQRPALRIPAPSDPTRYRDNSQRPVNDSNGGSQRGVADITNYGSVYDVTDSFSF
tara:strand:+ start:233 stop:562 length:330 start_codon:yes stop_codon:yes gene_type:complete